LDNGPPYNYAYNPPAQPNSTFDTPKFLCSANALESICVDLENARKDGILGIVHEPSPGSDRDKGKYEFRVSKRVLRVIKNTPYWWASEDDLAAIGIDPNEAQETGRVLGVQYEPSSKTNQKYRVSTNRRKQIERVFESEAEAFLPPAESPKSS